MRWRSRQAPKVIEIRYDEIDQCAPQQKISRQTDTTREKQMLWQYSSNRADRIPRKVQLGDWRWLGWGYHSEVIQQVDDPLNVSEKSRRRIRRLVEMMMRTMAAWNKKPTKTRINQWPNSEKQNTMKKEAADIKDLGGGSEISVLLQ